MSSSSSTKLDEALAETSDVFVGSGTDPARYFSDLAADIRANICDPFAIHATVVEPGFPDTEIGSTISGECVAHKDGYWLVYQPDQDRFYCFWGSDPANLGAHGVSGSPLYCWSA